MAKMRKPEDILRIKGIDPSNVLQDGFRIEPLQGGAWVAYWNGFCPLTDDDLIEP